jgi:hypothetical protein
MHLTNGNEFGLLPTPTAVQREHPERVEALKKTGAKSMMSRANGENRPNSILDAVNFYGMLPTPNASTWKTSGMSKEAWEKRIQDNRQQDLNMEIFVQTGQHSQHLNPQFVAEIMGFPTNWTELPFQNGETNQFEPTETPSSPM